MPSNRSGLRSSFVLFAARNLPRVSLLAFCLGLLLPPPTSARATSAPKIEQRVQAVRERLKITSAHMRSEASSAPSATAEPVAQWPNWPNWPNGWGNWRNFW